MKRLGVLLAALLGSAFSPVHSASLSEQLAELGHPETQACRVRSDKGLGDLFFIQFPQRKKHEEELAAAVAILELINDSLTGPSAAYTPS